MSKIYKKIGELVDEISMGPFGSDIKVEFFVDHGVPVLNGQNISDFKLKDCFKNYVTEERAAGYKKAIAKRGDIIITHRGTLGQIAYIPDDSEFEEYVISQSQFRVKLKSELVNPIYFTYYFHTDEGQKRLLSFKSHVGVPALAQATTNFRLLDFPIRSKTEQDAVANFLVKIDKKIDLNSRINTELEAMAKTLYDYWFVQFDFPDANGKPYKTSGGKMVYNLPLKRNIPVDWEVRTLSQIANITMGQSPVGESYNDDGNGSLFFQGSTDFGWLFPTPRQYTTSPARMAKKGDILLSVRAPVGDMNIANADCCIGRGLAALNSKSGSDGFLFYVMKYFKQVFDRRNSEGTTFGSITKDDLHSLEVIYPQNNILKKYDDIVSEFNKMIFLRSLENRDLIKLRDWLLPMLMNGQVTVR
ncbi:restriction endonuclease subunit S [Yersinia enterocolitica]|uniref:restriction endonuclease subunit S n=1 Tax=Yersinia massiliensis TaxID=419257 RepID=UPI00065B3B3E|nr:restriction endonuclease subunit S [Yersinia massiliensis]MCB5307294.1 restriction endonuclease subunit S [Yersinia massiliensis]MCB5316793.1 restriction endonuclease subunit S [Yersinia massiliensis]CRY64506.1 Predicted nucleotidyltransferases [Yersinia kristensenii]